MKAVIMAGGLGTRLAEETSVRPKPMVEIGGKPMLWHIMNIFAAGGVKEFCVACGYKGEQIKEYFGNFHLHHADLTVDMRTHAVDLHNDTTPDWRVHLVDTGLNTMTGGRIKRLADYIGDGTFMMTYGDGVADVPIDELLQFHRTHGRKATITAVQPPGRFGGLAFGEGEYVSSFQEKPQGDGAWINGGFFVLEPEVFDYIASDETLWEKEPLSKLSRDGQLAAFRHRGFWKPMDTLRDKVELEERWKKGRAEWKLW